MERLSYVVEFLPLGVTCSLFAAAAGGGKEETENVMKIRSGGGRRRAEREHRSDHSSFRLTVVLTEKAEPHAQIPAHKQKQGVSTSTRSPQA